MLLTALLIGLFAAARHDGPARRWLVEIPARRLGEMSKRDLLAFALLLLIAPMAGQLLIPELAWVMAFDIATLVEITAAAVIVTRVLPAWKGLRAAAVRLVRRFSRPAARARRASSPRRRPAKPPEPEDGWAFA
jgi:hypothetical protein